MRYFYHPESDSLFVTEDDDPSVERMDPLVEEVDEATYRSIEIRRASENDYWEHYWRTEMFEDLLG